MRRLFSSTGGPALRGEEKVKNFTVCLEGNISAGKTTLLRHFGQLEGIEVVEEPIDSWRDVGGVNLFDLMYQDPRRYMFQFQSLVQLTRLQLFNKPATQPVRLIERGIENNRYVFIENARIEGSLLSSEKAILIEWFEVLAKNMNVRPDLIVYLRTDPKVAYQRVVGRDRKEETTVTLAYLEALHERHEEWLLKEKFGPLCTPLLVIDGNQGREEMKEEFKKLEDVIRGNRAWPGGH